MRTKGPLPVFAMLLTFVVGCQAKPAGQEAAPPSAASPAAGTAQPVAPAIGATAPAPAAPPAQAPPATTPATPAAAPPSSAAPAPLAGAASPGAAPAGAPAVATQTSNWPGVVVDVAEFRRKGSTLTARVVLRNQGSANAQPDVNYNEVYVMDLAAGKKYEVLKDEKGTYIAALRSGWTNRWYEALAPGATFTIWMKFPAPPPEVKSVTLQIPGVPPFEDLPIQDS